MADRSEPAAEIDLYDVVTWSPRTWLDRLSVRIYGLLALIARGVVITAALAIVLAQFALSGLAASINPTIGVFVVLSVLPALAIAVYVWRVDVSTREPLYLLVATFVLGFLLAGFAAVLNSFAQRLFVGIPVVGMALFFYLIVAPVEETVKWLAVRLYAYRSDQFHAVLDGAVYGAVAGLGFATIENTIYIGQQYVSALQSAAVGPAALEAALGTALVRSFAGPGHVLYSAFAGYYLGLARFNRENAGPIVVKGLLIAAFIHATYNTLVGVVPIVVHGLYPWVSIPVAFIGFVVVYDGLVGFALYRKIRRYRAAFAATDGRLEDRAG